MLNQNDDGCIPDWLRQNTPIGSLSGRGSAHVGFGRDIEVLAPVELVEAIELVESIESVQHAGEEAMQHLGFVFADKSGEIGVDAPQLGGRRPAQHVAAIGGEV